MKCTHYMGGGMCQRWHSFRIPGSPTLSFISFLREVKIVAVCHSPGVWTPEETVYSLIDGLSVGGLPFPYRGCCYKKDVSVGRCGSAIWSMLTQHCCLCLLWPCLQVSSSELWETDWSSWVIGRRMHTEDRKLQIKPHMVTHTHNPSLWEVGARGSGVRG